MMHMNLCIADVFTSLNTASWLIGAFKQCHT